MRSRFLRSLTAAWLVVLLGVLHTGLPSHSHDVERKGSRGDHHRLSADRHGHGTLLIEQAERVQSNPLQLAATPVTIDTVSFPATPYTATYDRHPLRPLERAPPPGAPRAPPLSI
jgi:hypothetical protein